MESFAVGKNERCMIFVHVELKQNIFILGGKQLGDMSEFIWAIIATATKLLYYLTNTDLLLADKFICDLIYPGRNFPAASGLFTQEDRRANYTCRCGSTALSTIHFQEDWEGGRLWGERSQSQNLYMIYWTGSLFPGFIIDGISRSVSILQWSLLWTAFIKEFELIRHGTKTGKNWKDYYRYCRILRLQSDTCSANEAGKLYAVITKHKEKEHDRYGLR